MLPLLVIIFGLVAYIFFAAPANATSGTLKEQIKTNTMALGKAGFGDPADPTSGTDSSRLIIIIGNIVKVILGFLGVVMVIIVVYAGFLWMTAGGDSDQVKKAKDWIINATIGLLITIAAYTISGFIINKVFEAASAQQ